MNIHYKLLGSLLWIKSNDLENDINELEISGLVFGIASIVLERSFNQQSYNPGLIIIVESSIRPPSW